MGFCLPKHTSDFVANGTVTLSSLFNINPQEISESDNLKHLRKNASKNIWLDRNADVVYRLVETVNNIRMETIGFETPTLNLNNNHNFFLLGNSLKAA